MYLVCVDDEVVSQKETFREARKLAEILKFETELNEMGYSKFSFVTPELIEYVV